MPPLAVGQVWRHKGDASRTVTVISVDVWYDGQQHAYVVRSTSRRRQSISARTLGKEYRLVETR